MKTTKLILLSSMLALCKGEGLVSLEFSQNILDIAKIDSKYFTSSSALAKEATTQSHSQCISGCNKEYTNPDGTKIPGRGGCKANCWVDSAIKVLEAVATIVAHT